MRSLHVLENTPMHNSNNGYLGNKTYYEKMEDYITYLKDIGDKVDNPFPQTHPKL